MFDPSKPVQTRDGRKARILATDFKNRTYPILAAISNTHSDDEGCGCFTSDGLFGPGKIDEDDLINIPEKHVRYINTYRNFGYPNRALADEFQGDNRTGCILIEYEEGQYDE